MKYFLLKNVDGGVQVMQMVPQEDGRYSTPDEEVAKWRPSKQKEVQSWREIEPGHLPKDRSFRDAWSDGGKTVDVDMPKARGIHRDRLRALRAPKLAALDIEMTQAFNSKEKQIAIDAKRQALRAVTDDHAIDAAETPEELLAVLPDALK